MRTFNFLILISIIFVGCSAEEKSDAYGQFEATEITVSAETGGRLIDFTPEEGYRLEAGKQVGQIDTTRLALKRDELQARLEGAGSRIESIRAEAEVVAEELSMARTDLDRIRSLIKDGAATQKQLDDAEGRVRTLKKRIDALETQTSSVRAEMRSIRAQIAQLADQIADASIINPSKGIVLTTFVEPSELVGEGQPLYEIADLDTLVLRVFVSGGQLPDVRLNRDVEVLVDKNADENQTMTGRVSWIASESEFTPKMIQTKQERVNQVYAVKVRVPNPDGILKIGMPGEVNFSRGSAQMNAD